MGMLMDFYCGDARRIARAWRRGEDATLEDPAVVAAHVDFSYHLGFDDLDALALAACELAGQPPLSFSACLQRAPPQAESGIHELSAAFGDLLAGIPPEQVETLYQRWMERRPPEPPVSRRPWWKRLGDRMESAIGYLALGAILLPAFWLMWLFNREFRQERRRNRAALAAQGPEAPAPEAAGGTLSDALARLVEACRMARATGRSVLFAWSL